MAISEEWAQGSRNFCNKLWNATRFALPERRDASGSCRRPSRPRTAGSCRGCPRWVAEVDTHFENYEFAKACETLYHFAWDEFCDGTWSCPRSRADERRRPRRPGRVLDILLRLLHPLTPFVSEELWTALTGQPTIVGAVAGAVDVPFDDPSAEAEIAGMMRLVTEVRRFRADQGLKPGQKVAAVLEGIKPSHEAAVRALLRLTQPGETSSRRRRCRWTG